MDTVIRCHIKNEQRFELFKRTVQSWYDKEMYLLGDLQIVDDQSPEEYGMKVQQFCNDYNAFYHRTYYDADTKNGLYYSLKIAKWFPVLCCVDDMVFGRNSVDFWTKIITNDLRKINEKWACIGTFACYPRNVRNSFMDTSLWNIPNNALYALVCHLYSKEFSEILINQYEKFKKGQELTEVERYNLSCCDDIWVARNASTYGFKCYNSQAYDYAQHTGMNQRTFTIDEVGNSNYMSEIFIGE